MFRILGLIEIALSLLSSKDDPVRECEVYRQSGCAHVDGPLCDMKTCPELAQRWELNGHD